MRKPAAPRALSRREWLNLVGRTALAAPVLGLGLNTLGCGGGGGGAPNPPPGPPPISDAQLLDDLERAIFDFFWTEASATTGLVKDRALSGGNDTRTISSIAATGFGLTALCIADSRAYQPHAQLRDRAYNTLNFLFNQAPHQNGFFYHFMDMNTGARAWTSEVSSIDSAILFCGILTCRQHFQDAQITALANQIYQRADFNWMLNGGATLSMGWLPENGGNFLAARWDNYYEEMMLYLLAIGSTAHPILASSWNAIQRPTVNFQSFSYIAGAAPLFIHQYSHAWVDFRNKRDNLNIDYFQNSVTATLAHKAFCLSLAGQYPGYSNDLWGITASDSQNNGYVAWGGPPATGPIDGTVVPCAPAGSLPFAPPDTLRVLHTLRERYGATMWRRYGFPDAFNPNNGWVDPDVIGIDLGVSMLMAENYRTQFVWNTFMTNPEITAAMAQVGFH